VNHHTWPWCQVIGTRKIFVLLLQGQNDWLMQGMDATRAAAAVMSGLGMQ
jgi:hypothetical protein